MIVYANKYLAMQDALSDEIVVKVEGGYMLISRMEIKRMKRK